MGYIYLLFALTGGLVKGFTGKKISRDIQSVRDSLFVNTIRMLLCALIGAGLLLMKEGHKAFYISGNEIMICCLSAVAMCFFCVCWMCAYRSAAYMFLSVVSMLGSVFTCLCGLLIYHEPIGVGQWGGILLLFLAIFIMSKYNKDLKEQKGFSKKELLILALGCVGLSFSDFSQKIFILETGKSASILNFYTYAIAFVLLLVLFFTVSLVKKDATVSQELLSKENITGYLCISAFLYLNSICKTMAVSEGLTTAQIYPVLNGANLIASAILARILLKEKITKKSIIGMLCAFLGLLAINLL